ncbi:MAG: hypothetical protein AAF063_21280 [Cyanobacteria bacterium J06643_5]
MIRRLALTAGFAFIGAVAFTPKAHGQAAPAAAETVPFEATIGSVCTLSNPQQGDLVKAGDLLTSNPTDGGARGKIDVECTGGNTISVAAPVEVSVPTFSKVPGSEKARVFNAGTEIANSDANLTGSVAPGNVTVEVEMEVIQNGPGFPPGVYQYNVEVTAAPN